MSAPAELWAIVSDATPHEDPRQLFPTFTDRERAQEQADHMNARPDLSNDWRLVRYALDDMTDRPRPPRCGSRHEIPAQRSTAGASLLLRCDRDQHPEGHCSGVGPTGRLVFPRRK